LPLGLLVVGCRKSPGVAQVTDGMKIG